MLQDLRFTLRLMGRERWFTTACIVVLALGIGANATVFTLVQAALLSSLPFKDADRLAVVSPVDANSERRRVSEPELEDWRSQNQSFSGLAGYREGPMNLSDDRAFPEKASGAWLSANAFDVLAQPPLLGRAFVPGDDRPGAAPVVVLGARLWRHRYNSDSGVVGQPIRVNGEPATIVGVMPDHVRFPISADVWMPLAGTEADRARTARRLRVFGRLRDEVSFAGAQAEMAGIVRRLAAAYPDPRDPMAGAQVETFTERFVGGAGKAMMLTMMGAVCFLLLIACANVANLLLSRSAHRAREVALRMALGASRRRVLGQLLVESLVLGVIGGGLGLLIAVVAVPIFDASVQDPGKPFWIVFAVNYRVVGYVAAVCVLTGVLFGLAPALHVSRTNLNDLLNEGGRANASAPRLRFFSGAMVVSQLTLTCVLLVGAGLLIRSFVNAYRLDIGMPTARVMAMQLDLTARRYDTPDAKRAFFDQLTTRLSGVAGIDGSALTTSLPLAGAWSKPFEIDGRVARAPGDSRPLVATVTIDPAFFEVARVPLLRGRSFASADGAPGNETVVVNERVAARYFPNEDPIGRRLRFVDPSSEPGAPAPVWRTIVGVSGTVWHSSLREDEPAGVVYVPLRQEPPASVQVMVRSALAPGAVMDAVRRETRAIDPDQPVFTIQTLDERLAEQRWPIRVFGILLGVFGLIGLTLATLGLYAVMAYAVTQRTQEIGVRVALGADATQVSWLVLRRGLVQLAIGLGLGLAGAFVVSRALQRSLVQVDPRDPLTFTCVALLLAFVALVACLVPARRAARIDPLVALRG